MTYSYATMQYILMMWWSVSGPIIPSGLNTMAPSTSVAFHTQEFNSSESCEHALAIVRKQLVDSSKSSGGVCLLK